MTPQVLLSRADQALQEIRAALATATPSPRTRELKARFITFERATMTFAGRVPTHDQASALLEAVLELHTRVFEAQRSSGRPTMASTPAMRAVMTNPRVALPHPRPSQRPTANPPPLLSRPPCARSSPPRVAVTMPPPSSRKG